MPWKLYDDILNGLELLTGTHTHK